MVGMPQNNVEPMQIWYTNMTWQRYAEPRKLENPGYRYAVDTAKVKLYLC